MAIQTCVQVEPDDALAALERALVLLPVPFEAVGELVEHARDAAVQKAIAAFATAGFGNRPGSDGALTGDNSVFRHTVTRLVTDDITKNLYPMPLTASKKYDVEVGRIRKNDVFGENGLDLFVCGDQLLRGAALNAVLIAEAVCD